VVVVPHSPKPGVKGLSGVLQDARAREEADRQDRHRTEELGDACGKVEEDLEALKGRFELYFLGIDRREPVREREEMKRRVARLKGEFTRNTGLRFRIETLHCRFLAYERMWMRSAREKEEGTYRRDLVKARRRAEIEAKREVERGKDGVPTLAAASVPSPSQPPPRLAGEPAPAVAKPDPIKPPSSAGAPPPREGITDQQLRALHAAYVEAKKRCNEDVSRLSYEALAKIVSKQVPELMAKYKAKTVEFKVVIKDGRAILKAVPRV